MTVFWWVLETLLALAIGVMLAISATVLALFLTYWIRTRLANRDAKRHRQRMTDDLLRPLRRRDP